VQDVSFRPARKSDCRVIAELYHISSDGVADYIWSSLAGPGEDILDVGQRRYEQEDSVFSYNSCTMVEIDGKVVGMLVAFPMPADSSETDGDEDVDPVLAPYRVLEEPDSYYICGMALFDRYRGRGVGRRLLKLAEEHARQLDLRKLSLIVFEQNAGARSLYEREGFVEKMRVPVVRHPLIHYQGDALLMVKDLEGVYLA
jgi:ribosomal protein S18 acetylase RimI-like enzyme